MTKFTQKYSLISMLEPAEEGLEFFWKDYPLHITLASVFAVDWESTNLFDKLTKLLAEQKPVTVKAVKEDYWGKNKEYHMVELEKTPEIMELHHKILKALLEAGAVFNEPQYAGDGFVPHSTIQKHARLHVGDQVSISDLTILDMFPGKDGYKRKLLRTIRFGG